MAELVEIVSENQVEVFRRLVPPAELLPEEAEEFRRVVDATPAEMLPPASLAAMIQYCRHFCFAKRIAERLEDAVREGRGHDVETLSRAQARETRIITHLMTSLRLTPQSLDPGRRAIAKHAVTIANPWDGKRSRKGNLSPP